MKNLIDYMREAKTFYLATVEDNKPKVRPIGGKPILGEDGFIELDGKIYYYTDNRKPMYKQMKANPFVAITYIVSDGFIRLTGKAVFDNNTDAKKIIIDENKSLSQLYNYDDEFFEVYYIEDIEAFLFAKGQEPAKLN